MSVLIPLLFASGVLLIFRGLTEDPSSNRPSRRIAAPSPSARALLGFVTIGLGVFIVMAGVSGSAVVGGAVAVAAASIPLSRERAARVKAQASVRDQWPDAIAMLIASIRAGIALPQACMDVAARAPEGLRPGLTAFVGAYRASGSFRVALTRMREVMADPIADRVCVALMLAHEVGGTDLVRMLRTLADQVRDEQRVRREVVARWSWTLTAARVAALAPWAVLALMATRPEAARAYDTPAGAVTILAGGIATVVGYRLMLQAGRLPDQRRLG